MFLQTADAGMQLLASNLNYLLRFLADDVPQMKAYGPETIRREPDSGGALFLHSVAQKREGGL